MRKNTENVDLFFLYIYEYIKKANLKYSLKKCIRNAFAEDLKTVTSIWKWNLDDSFLCFSIIYNKHKVYIFIYLYGILRANECTSLSKSYYVRFIHIHMVLNSTVYIYLYIAYSLTYINGQYKNDVDNKTFANQQIGVSWFPSSSTSPSSSSSSDCYHTMYEIPIEELHTHI